MLSVGKTAKLLGISIRTLHYYDEINLVKPSYTAPSGYRYYDDDAVELLQQVIFLRELEIPVKQIKKILGSPDCDREFLLKGHRQLLLVRKAHIENLISLIDKRIGVNNMDYREGIAEEQLKSEFADEVRRRWGDTPQYREYEEKIKNHKSEDNTAGADEIFKAFAEAAGSAPDDREVQELVRRWQEYITANYYKCSDEVLLGLAEMYTADSRFKDYLDSFGAGTAQLMSDAIKCYCR